MGRACSIHEREERVKSEEKRDHESGLGVRRRIILKRIVTK
jgi:hypothetical protein